MPRPSEPKTYKIPSRSYGITAAEAADVLVAAEEVRKNKPLMKAAVSILKEKKKALNSIKT